MKFDLVTPAKLLASQTASHVMASGEEGDFGVLPGHSPFISTLRPGALTVEGDNKTDVYFVGYGFVDVNPEGVTVLAEEAELKEDINVEEAKEKLANAEKAVSTLFGNKEKAVEYAKAVKAKAIFSAKLAVANS